MSILTNLITTSGNTSRENNGIVKELAATLKKTSEIFWLTTSLALFIVMGPFSALAVIPALFSLSSEKYRNRMQEPERI